MAHRNSVGFLFPEMAQAAGGLGVFFSRMVSNEEQLGSIQARWE